MVLHAAQYSVIAIVLHAVDGQIVRVRPRELVTVGATIEQTKCGVVIARQYRLIVLPQEVINRDGVRIQNLFSSSGSDKMQKKKYIFDSIC